MEQKTAKNTVWVCRSTPKTWCKPLWSGGVTGAAFLSSHVTNFHSFSFRIQSAQEIRRWRTNQLFSTLSIRAL